MKQDDNNKNIDILIDIDDVENKALPYQTLESDKKFINFVKTKLAEMEEKRLTLEELKINKINKLEKERDELLAKVDNLQREVENLSKQNKLLEEAGKPSTEYDNEILEKLIFPINTIDQIASAYRNTGENELIAEQLEKVAELTIQQISSVGIEEIPVYGKEIDGEYMESFGPASHVKDESLSPHAVAIVSRRAFKKTESDEIIQHALVYTVPEEG